MITREDHGLWVERYRPSTMETYIGNEHLKSKVSIYLESGDLPHLLLYGRAGTGKTTLAKLLVKNIECDYLYINASDENNVDTGFVAFSWEESWNLNDNELQYHLRVSSTAIGDHDVDTTGTTVLVSYQEIIELMMENNTTTAYIDWTVYVTDGTDTLEADNAPFSFIIDGENALSTYLEQLIPAQYALHQNYPNPFNPVTTVRYDLPENSLVTITIYDMLGKEISTIVNEYQDAGYKSIVWNATNDYGQSISAGIYIYQIKTKDFVQTKKMILLK